MTSRRSFSRSILGALSLGLLAAAAALGWPRDAKATGIMVARFGGELGNPMAENPTALYYNPAGIAFSHGTNVYVEGLFALRSFSFDRDAAAIDNPGKTPGTPTDGIAANSGKGSLFNFLASPFAGVTSDLGVPNLAVGISISVPFGGSQMWDKNSAFQNSTKYPGAVDGSQRWWDIEGTIQSMYFTVGGAYKLPYNVSVGLAANIIQSKTYDLRAANADGRDDLVDANGNVLEGRAFLDSSGIGFSLGAGVAWEPTPEWRIGVSYQSQPNFGTVTETGTLTKKLGLTATNKNNIEHKYDLPDIVRFGVSFKATPQIDLRLWGSFERWSTFKRECMIDTSVPTRSCDKFNADGSVNDSAQNPAGVVNAIPRFWQDAISARLSGSYHLNPQIELQLGLGWEGNAVPDETLELSLPDGDKLNFTVGGVFRNLLAQNLSILASYSTFIGFERAVKSRVYQFPSRVPNSSGTYNEITGVFELGIGYAF